MHFSLLTTDACLCRFPPKLLTRRSSLTSSDWRSESSHPAFWAHKTSRLWPNLACRSRAAILCNWCLSVSLLQFHLIESLAFSLCSNCCINILRVGLMGGPGPASRQLGCQTVLHLSSDARFVNQLPSGKKWKWNERKQISNDSISNEHISPLRYVRATSKSNYKIFIASHFPCAFICSAPSLLDWRAPDALHCMLFGVFAVLLHHHIEYHLSSIAVCGEDVRQWRIAYLPPERVYRRTRCATTSVACSRMCEHSHHFSSKC